tara:strand:- start:379 stop:555 length:177 start_codon:yes stop_codon:yes gene_type:complete
MTPKQERISLQDTIVTQQTTRPNQVIGHVDYQDMQNNSDYRVVEAFFGRLNISVRSTL